MSDRVPTSEAARILGVDNRTVHYYARDYDDFPKPTRFGRALSWDPDELREWRDEHPTRKKGG